MCVRDVEKAIIAVEPIIEDYYDCDADPNERETRRRIIDPILNALGWGAPRRSANCLPEYRVNDDTKHRVDYAMFTETGAPTIIVEAKRLFEDTRDWEDDALFYVELADAESITAVLTNGEYWQIFQVDEFGEFSTDENPIGLLWEGATAAEQAQRLYDALSFDKHRTLRNRSGDMRRWR